MDKLGLGKLGIHLPAQRDQDHTRRARRVEPVIAQSQSANAKYPRRDHRRDRSPSKESRGNHSTAGSSIASHTGTNTNMTSGSRRTGPGAESVVSGLTSHSRHTGIHRTPPSVASNSYKYANQPSSERKRTGHDPKWSMYERSEGPSIFFDDTESLASYTSHGRSRMGIYSYCIT
jgi:hypothetical protein